MGSIHKHIKLNVQMKIDDDGQKEEHQQSLRGKIVRKGNIDVITYNEAIDNDKIDNFITIQPQRVTLKRSGLISMNQKFQPNQWTETMYKHPYGSIYMETFTKEITYQTDSEAREGTLHISYTVKLNHQERREHKWLLTFQEEEEK